MAYKTREKLIEVARQLFVHKGVDNTTMNDIATASDKGRRTIYTYFKSKVEIYKAVIERESEKQVAVLRSIAETPGIPANEKLTNFLLASCSPPMDSNGNVFDSFLSMFSRDFKKMKKVRTIAYDKEHALVDKILQEGIDGGIFDPDQCRRMRGFIRQWMVAVDWAAATRTSSSPSDIEFQRNLVDFMVRGTMKSEK